MNKINFVKMICTLLVLGVLLSGCSGGQRLSDLTIVQAVGVDVKDKKTQVSMQYLNFDKNSGSTEALSQNITTVAYGTADSISSAISVASGVLSKKVFFGQNKLIVFGGDYVQSNLKKGLDYLVRSIDSRPDVLVAMCDKRAADVVSVNENDVKLPADKIYDLLTLGEKTGFGASVSVNDLLNMYADKTSDIYLPVLSVEDNRVKCSGIAIFSGDYYRKTLTPTQSLGMLFINGNIKNGSISVSSKKLGNVGVEVLSSGSKKSVYMSDGQLHFDVKIRLKMSLEEVEHGITTSIKDKEIKEIEALVGNRVRAMCLSAVGECLSSGSDVFMMGKHLALSNMAQYDKLKDSWRDIIQAAVVDIRVDARLKNVNDNSVRQ